MLIAMDKQDNCHIHHRWVPQMILEEFFLLLPFLFTLILIRMVWRFVQQEYSLTALAHLAYMGLSD